MAHSVDPDEMALYEPSHLDLHCLQWYMFWSARLKVLKDSFARIFPVKDSDYATIITLSIGTDRPLQTV